MYRKNYSVNDMPQIRNAPPPPPPEEKVLPVHSDNVEEKIGFIQNGKVLGRFETDDIILIVIAIILLADDCDDKLLILALGFVFLSGII